MADAAEEVEKATGAADAGGFKRTAKDLFGGAVGGAVQVLVGMISPLLFRYNSLEIPKFRDINSYIVEWEAPGGRT